MAKKKATLKKQLMRMAEPVRKTQVIKTATVSRGPGDPAVIVSGKGDTEFDGHGPAVRGVWKLYIKNGKLRCKFWVRYQEIQEVHGKLILGDTRMKLKGDDVLYSDKKQNVVNILRPKDPTFRFLIKWAVPLRTFYWDNDNPNDWSCHTASKPPVRHRSNPMMHHLDDPVGGTIGMLTNYKHVQQLEGTGDGGNSRDHEYVSFSITFCNIAIELEPR